jgi:hypothetical protein
MGLKAGDDSGAKMSLRRGETPHRKRAKIAPAPPRTEEKRWVIFPADFAPHSPSHTMLAGLGKYRAETAATRRSLRYTDAGGVSKSSKGL